ncbi:MAG: hypothetical protein ABIS50_17375 [Luteolibacter sp.]|uniref:hypothetical protein n=1 Tax=Luteolibacter sp. TaxID=1962973 RepID=UPI003266BB2C
MNPTQDPRDFATEIQIPRKRSFWQKLGGGSLSISLFLHVILLAVGVIWVFQIIPEEQDKVIPFMPKSGGGPPASESQVKKQNARMMQANLSRLVANGTVSPIVLPEIENSSQMTSMGSISPEGISGRLEGTRGGEGNDHGPGVGNGMAPGMSNGTGSKNPFGALDMTPDALVGTFYDLKQTSNREQTNMTDDEMRVEVRDIVRRGFKEKTFEKYFKAPSKLYQTKFQIPIMSADGAPAAFDVEKEVQPKRWVVVYRGSVKAPHSGKFRFVGAADDLLVVNFNNRPVFDYGYTLASTGTHLFNRGRDMDGTTENRELAKEVRRLSPMRIPITFYKYAQTPKYNENIGGMAVGPEFEAREGQTYPIEILIGEIPGGYFSVSLLIEEIGVHYQKDPGGAPILPLFRLDQSLPNPEMKGEAPPFDPSGPIWKSMGSAVKQDI